MAKIHVSEIAHGMKMGQVPPMDRWRAGQHEKMESPARKRFAKGGPGLALPHLLYLCHSVLPYSLLFFSD
jgi:hypothetical protein